MASTPNFRRDLTTRWAVVSMALLGASAGSLVLPLDAKTRSHEHEVELESRRLAPVDPRDRGSLLTRGVGSDPVLSASEERILADAYAAVREARARNAGSTTTDRDALPPAEIDRRKLEILADHPAPATDGFPDAHPKED